MSGPEIKQLSEEKGRAFITDTICENLLAYSVDTPVEGPEQWNNTKILIHEATFLNNQHRQNKYANKHSFLEDVLKMVSGINIEKLVLSHFSSRYSAEEIDEAIKKYCKAFHIQIPVYRILPGEVNMDILNSDPINA